MTQYEYDISVIGGGPGGYVAAISAAKEGKKVCIIEAASYGGVCLNQGCIPTKTLIKTASLLSEMRQAAEFGIEGIDPASLGVSMPKLQQRRKKVVSKLVGGVKALLKANGVTMVQGLASFVDAHTLSVGDARITAAHTIIATGSTAFMPPFIALEDGAAVITSKEALELDAVPASIAIIGGGVIGVEFAYLLNKLGSTVTVLELMDGILPMVDADVAAMAKKRMEKAGITFHTGTKVTAVRGNTVLFEKDGASGSLDVDCVLMAVGRVPNTQGLNAEGIGLAFNGKAIAVDSQLRTNIPGVFAIGDVNGQCMLAHTASHEGMVAVATICGREAAMDYSAIPSCIYLDPEIACIGLTEEQARKEYPDLRVGKFPMAANGKSLVEGDTDGMAKVIVNTQDGQVLGVHLYAKHSTDMIAELALAMNLKASAEDIISTIHPHPTISEAVPEAFMAAFGKAIHCL